MNVSLASNSEFKILKLCCLSKQTTERGRQGSRGFPEAEITWITLHHCKEPAEVKNGHFYTTHELSVQTNYAN